MPVRGATEKKFYKLISEMNIGERGYIRPWSLFFTLDKIPYLDIADPVVERTDDLFDIPISRFGSGPADYDVDISRTDYRFERKDIKWKFRDTYICIDPQEHEIREFLNGLEQEIRER